MVVAVDLLDPEAVAAAAQASSTEGVGDTLSDPSPSSSAVRLPLTTIQVGRGSGLVDQLLWPQAPQDLKDPGCAAFAMLWVPGAALTLLLVWSCVDGVDACGHSRS